MKTKLGDYATVIDKIEKGVHPDEAQKDIEPLLKRQPTGKKQIFVSRGQRKAIERSHGI